MEGNPSNLLHDVQSAWVVLRETCCIEVNVKATQENKMMAVFEFILYNKYDLTLPRRIRFAEYHLTTNFKYLSEKYHLI